MLQTPADQDLLVFGASGNLAERKLYPALYNLFCEGLLPAKGLIIGTAPDPNWSDDEFVSHIHEGLHEFSRTGVDEGKWQQFAARLRYLPLDPQGDLAPLQAQFSEPSRVCYLAVPSSAFAPVISNLEDKNLVAGTSVIIEKPFGHDTDSGRALNAELHRVFPEDRIYRIDHYLGKETVQNLLVFRFGNSVFERVWNRDAISSVELLVAESEGIGTRGAFYEETGALRDIVQNHAMQLLALTTMEPPSSFSAASLKTEKIQVLQAVQLLDPKTVVRGQYGPGNIDGKPVPGYRQEGGVDPNSNTETLIEAKLSVDTWRWAGVPFYLKTGKRLPKRESLVTIHFHDAPLHLFGHEGITSLGGNTLVMRIQPDEGIDLSFVAKEPGPSINVQDVHMDFAYQSSFKTSPPEAYERLLYDAMIGDHTLFISQEEIERGWEIVQPVLDNPPAIKPYAAGSWGP